MTGKNNDLIQEQQIGAQSWSQVPTMRRFDQDADDWTIYLETLEYYFCSLNITEEAIKKASFINLIGTKTYTTLRDLCAPDIPAKKTYKELCQIMGTHFIPTVIIYKERKMFYSAAKTRDESISEFIIRLKGLAAKCKFGADFNKIVKDKFVSCLDGQIFDKICEEDETMDLEKAIKISLRMEIHIKSSKEIQYVSTQSYKHQGHRTGSSLSSNWKNSSTKKINL